VIVLLYAVVTRARPKRKAGVLRHVVVIMLLCAAVGRLAEERTATPGVRMKGTALFLQSTRTLVFEESDWGGRGSAPEKPISGFGFAVPDELQVAQLNRT
jgi:hypothetical protein